MKARRKRLEELNGRWEHPFEMANRHFNCYDCYQQGIIRSGRTVEMRIKLKNGWNPDDILINSLLYHINARDQVEAFIDSHLVIPPLLQFLPNGSIRISRFANSVNSMMLQLNNGEMEIYTAIILRQLYMCHSCMITPWWCATNE